jgi:pantoate--beta-alanine ligase
VKVIAKISEIRATIEEQKASGKRVGFVPTMGFLHQGHLSLVKESLLQSDCSVVSIFVNPAQFGPQEDLQKYPRDMGRDSALLDELGVDFLFVPDKNEMYPEGFRTYVEVTGLQDDFEGRSRPGHFRGVCTVVLKLLEIVKPDVAFFGQKDAQQAAVIKRMVRDLNLDLDIQVLPIIREKDGLALSSRNIYLTLEQRKAATCLIKSLREAGRLIENGERDPGIIRNRMERVFDSEPLADLDYIAIVDLDNFQPLATIGSETLIAIAAKIGTTRLIDNMIYRSKE